jgi:hypothetical protein
LKKQLKGLTADIAVLQNQADDKETGEDIKKLEARISGLIRVINRKNTSKQKKKESIKKKQALEKKLAILIAKKASKPGAKKTRAAKTPTPCDNTKKHNNLQELVDGLSDISAGLYIIAMTAAEVAKITQGRRSVVKDAIVKASFQSMSKNIKDAEFAEKMIAKAELELAPDHFEMVFVNAGKRKTEDTYYLIRVYGTNTRN